MTREVEAKKIPQKPEDYDVLRCYKEEPARPRVRVGRAMISICFPIGLKGECKYSHTRKEYIFNRLLTVSGMNLGLQSTISYSCARRKSHIVRCEYTVMCV